MGSTQFLLTIFLEGDLLLKLIIPHFYIYLAVINNYLYWVPLDYYTMHYIYKCSSLILNMCHLNLIGMQTVFLVSIFSIFKRTLPYFSHRWRYNFLIGTNKLASCCITWHQESYCLRQRNERNLWKITLRCFN